jgi:hypothetical protein
VSKIRIKRSSGTALKEQGMSLALSPDRLSEWKRAFRRSVISHAANGHAFTSEDVLDDVGLPSSEIATNANNAVGAMMNAMAKMGYITKTNERRVARRPSSHGRELAVWIGA